MLFSERMGITSKKQIQYESMDEDLRNGLWNIFINEICYKSSLNELAPEIWTNFLKKPTDEIPKNYAYGRPAGLEKDWIKNIYLNEEYHIIYNLLEFIINNINNSYIGSVFISECNKVFERECAGYRFVNNQITPITSKEEIKSIEESINSSDDSIKIHMSKALEFLSDRENPNYRNSIKESISAVEYFCRKITEKKNLGNSLTEIEKTGIIEFHPALKEGLSKIYGWTSDEGGIRHPIMEKETVDFSDAKFMLVSCSAFINYLTHKREKAGISQ